MKVKLFIYIITTMSVLWAMDSVNLNFLFKKNKIYQARMFYFFVTLSLIYLVTNFFYDFYLSLN
jgi:uncharacterized membrane protein YwzB